MIPTRKVIYGIINFIENAVLPQLPLTEHMGYLFAINIFKQKVEYLSENIIKNFKEKPFINMLGIIEDNAIDVNTIENALCDIIDKKGCIELKGEHISSFIGCPINLYFLEGLKLDKKGLNLLIQHIKQV